MTSVLNVRCNQFFSCRFVKTDDPSTQAAHRFNKTFDKNGHPSIQVYKIKVTGSTCTEPVHSQKQEDPKIQV